MSNGGFWDIDLNIGDLIQGGLGWWGQERTKDAALDAAKIHSDTMSANADAAMAASMPWAVGGTGGMADFDPEGRAALLELSPELQNIYSGALGRSGLWERKQPNLWGTHLAQRINFIKCNRS